MQPLPNLPTLGNYHFRILNFSTLRKIIQNVITEEGQEKHSETSDKVYELSNIKFEELKAQSNNDYVAEKLEELSN